MKKLAIGCGLVLLLTGMAAAGVAYYLYSKVSSTLTQFAGLSEVPEIERRIRNRTPFTPPASMELTDSQIEKLIRVQSDVRRRLGERISAFEARYKDLAGKDDASLTDAPDLIRAYGDLAGMWLDAKRGQVEALNATGLSLEEYRWIREQGYRALGLAFVDLDISRLVDAARRGAASDAGRLTGALESAGPASNRERLEKLRRELEEHLPLASFGF